MKCSKCGEKCKSKQVFCIKCGLPIQVIPDFNLIEAELAKNIGKYLNDNNNTVEYSNIEINDILDNEIEKYDNSEDIEKESSNLHNKKNNKTYKNQKKLFLGVSICAIAIIMAISFIAIKINANNNANLFISRYSNGIKLYNKEKFDDSLKELLVAQSLSKTDEDKVLAKEALWDTYSKIDDKDKEIIKILNDLIKLKPEESTYYQALATLYIENNLDKEFAKLINSVKNKEIYELISMYGIAQPEANIKSGDFEKYISIELEAVNDYDIYYTLDGSEPSNSSTLYELPIQIKNEGSTVLKAVTLKDNMESSIMTEEYHIKLSQLSSPLVALESGNYFKENKISVSCQENANLYYTFDGSIPTKDSTIYKGEIDLPKGNNVFNVIAINDNGIKSPVVTNIYNLQISEENSDLNIN